VTMMSRWEDSFKKRRRGETTMFWGDEYIIIMDNKT
jgi:hypothetical protein